MNGARSTFMRRGYLLTALAAAALLAASPGTALAQNTTGVTITGPPMNTVAEGGTATYTVTVRGYVDAAADAMNPTAASAVTVSLGTAAAVAAPDSSTPATEGEAADLNNNAHVRTVTFNTPANASTTSPLLFTGSQTISVVTLHDNDAENEAFTLAFSLDADGSLDQGADNDDAIVLAAAGQYNPNALTIDDDETQTYALSIAATAMPSEGDALTVTGTAMPAHEDGSSGALDLYTDPATGYTLGAQTLTIDGDATADTVTITQTADDNRSPDTVTLSAYSPTDGPGADTLVASVEITFADDNALPAVTVTVTNSGGTPLDPQPTSVAEGDTIHVRATAVDADGDPAAFAEELTIKLRAGASGEADARDIVAPGDLTIAANANPPNSAAVELTIFGPDEDVGDEMLTLDATVSGSATVGTETSTSAGVLTLTITDNTDRKIWALPQDEAYPKITDAIDAGDGDDDVLNPEPQESFTVDASGLFGRAQDYSATYSATADSGAVSLSQTGTMITVTAEEEGEAKVTITGTAAMSSAFEADQSISNVASITFPVSVMDSDLMVMVAADSPIDEGGTSEITATANRMVTAADGAVAVDLLVVGDATVDSDSIMIAMGDMSGSAMLTATADDDTDNETVTVIASGSGIDGNQSIEIAVNDTTEVPPDPMPTNVITPNAQDDAYPIITGAIEAGAGAEGLNPGESFSVDASELFTVMEGYSASYSASVDGDSASANVAGSMVMVSADAVGDSKVTVTGTATMASSLEGGQPATNVATQTFPVSVVYKDLVVTAALAAGNVDEGASVALTATANRPVDGDVALDVTVTGDTAAVSVGDLSIAAGGTEGMADVMAVEDDDTANAEVTLVVSGDGIETPISVSLSVMDNDRTVTALAQASVDALFSAAVSTAAGGDMWLPGGNDAMVDMSSLFEIEDGATVEYEVSSSNEDAVMASASGAMLSLSPAATGSSTIMVTATDTSGDDYDTASVSSMVSVGMAALTVHLDMPDNVMDGNIVEGETYMIHVHANRMVTEEEGSVEVMIMRDRAQSDADDSDYTVSSATIMAGYDEAEAELVVTEDMEPDSGTNDNMGEQLVLYGEVNGMEINSLTFTIWDAAVPALPLIAQILLALFLALGGARLYRRRQG